MPMAEPKRADAIVRRQQPRCAADDFGYRAAADALTAAARVGGGRDQAGQAVIEMVSGQRQSGDETLEQCDELLAGLSDGGDNGQGDRPADETVFDGGSAALVA